MAEGLLGFVTDLEGDLERWQRYVQISRVLQRGADGALELLEGARFAYGGDVVDQQPGDLELLQELVALKRRYPDRVTLILGNRDINKLRLATELSAEHQAAHPLRSHAGVYWDAAATPSQKLPEEDLEGNTAASRLRWILCHTMGAPLAFEARREELSRAAGGAAVVDDEVVQSFAEYARPGGALFEYFRCARLAELVGDTLFLHAGLPRGGDGWAPGWVPGWVSSRPERSGLPLAEWLEALEALRASALAECEEAAAAGAAPPTEAWSTVGGYTHAQPGCALMQYCMRDVPGGARQPSIVYNGWLGDDYQPLELDEATAGWLRAAGVRRVVSGHLPHGDAPLVLRAAEGIDAITADVSYGRQVQWQGEAVELGPGAGRHTCEVLLGPGPEDGLIHGVLSNGLAFEARLSDPAVGCLTADGWRVKGRADGCLVLSRNEQWSFEARLVREEDIGELTQGPVPSTA
mmetsp:Transcript_8515/g.26485  ORF Transcript_8515/g.26485 Transcript_8515/m.26485 type:complete len:465 (-) Transcript_8515:101-1495(-)